MPEKRARGFAAMNPEQQRQIASMGGRAAHQRGTAHEWDSREAAEAGRKGGKAAHHRGATHTDASAQNGHPASSSEAGNGALATTPNGRSAPEWSETEYENRGTPSTDATRTTTAGSNLTTV